MGIPTVWIAAIRGHPVTTFSSSSSSTLLRSVLRHLVSLHAMDVCQIPFCLSISLLETAFVRVWSEERDTTQVTIYNLL